MNEAFIDGQNFWLGTTEADSPWTVDLCKFRNYLDRKYDISKAYYYMGVHTLEHQDIYDEIMDCGFLIRFREHSNQMSSPKKGNVDTDIVFGLMSRYADKLLKGKAILVSGDGDYFRMVKYLIEKDKFLKVLAPNKKRMSTLYRGLSSQYYDFLDSEGIKRKIAK